MEDWQSMTPDPNSIQVLQSIELAVAPVFLLLAVGTILIILTNRLARVIDRTRKLKDPPHESGVDLRDRQDQLRLLERRARLANRAITMSVICALFISSVVVTIFVSEFVAMNLSIAISVLFILGMLSFVCALLLLLREISLGGTASPPGLR